MNGFFETKAALQADEAGLVSGIAWPFGTADRVGDMIEKGAFAGANLPIPMLFAHDPRDPVGVWEEIVEDAEGLQVKGRLLVDDLPRAREVRALLMSGAVGGLSIGFSPKKSFIRKSDGGRTLTALDLAEISLVSVPCHPGAKVRVKKAAASAIALAEALNRAAAALSNV